MPITEDRVARLREFGLSEYAARAYLALLDLGVSEASDISKLTKVPTSKIYHVLDQLHEKGLVEILPEFPKKYAPVAFSEFLEKVRREHAEAASQIAMERDELSKLFSVVGNVEIGGRGNFAVVRGRRNVLEKTSEIIEAATESILVIGTSGTVERDLNHRQALEAARSRGVSIRYLVPLHPEGDAACEALATVAELRARDADAAPRAAGVGILLADARQAFIVNYIPDDASVYTGKDVGIFTDHEAIVAALDAVLAPTWARAAPYRDEDAPTLPSETSTAARLEEGFRRAFEDAGIGKAITAPDGRIVQANAALAGMLLRQAEDVVGSPVLAILHPHDREAAERRFADVVAHGQPSRFEARLPPRGDRTPWVKVTISSVRHDDGRVAEVIVQLDDISTAKAAEDELKRALSLLTATLESTADGILVVDREGRVVSHNQRFLQIWRTPEAARESEAYLQQLKDADSFLRKIREADERPDAETFDLVEFKDGRVFERHSQPQRVGTQVVGRVWCFRDVTGQRRVEQALRQAEVYYRGLVQSARAVFWRADPVTSDFTFVSREAENLLGYPVGRWLSEPGFWADRVHPEDRDWVLAFRRQSTREKRAHEYEYRMVAEDGRTVWVRDIVRVAVKDEKPVELVGVMIDISDRKEAEESLRDHSDRLAELVTTQRDIAHGNLALDDLLLLACIRAQRLTRADAGILGIVRDGTAVVAAASGSAAHLVGRPLDGFAALCLKTGETVRSDDAEVDPRVDVASARETRTRGVAVIPLKRGDQVVGVLEVTSEEASAFSERDVDMLGILGGLVTAALGTDTTEVSLKPKQAPRKATRN